MTKSNQDNFLDELERLCGRYSSRGMWEWRIGSEDRDGIHFKYFFVDVEDTE